MVDDQALKEWFLSRSVAAGTGTSAFIRRNWRDAAEVVDLGKTYMSEYCTGRGTACQPGGAVRLYRRS